MYIYKKRENKINLFGIIHNSHLEHVAHEKTFTHFHWFFGVSRLGVLFPLSAPLTAVHLGALPFNSSNQR